MGLYRPVMTTSFTRRVRAFLLQDDRPIPGVSRFALNVLRLIYFTLSEFHRSRCTQRALELAYGTLFTLVPLTTLFLLISRLGGSLDRWIQDGRRFIVNLTIGILPPEDTEAIDAFLNHAFSAISRGLETASTFTSVVSFLVLVAFSISLLLGIENVFNGIFGVRRRRALVARVTVFWTVLTLSPLLLAFSMYLRARIVDMLVTHNWISPFTQWGLQFLFPFGFSALAFFVLYFKMPYTRVRVGAAAGGAIAACALWEWAKGGVAWYVLENVSYKNIYGTLGTIPVFLLFLYVTWVIILLGAEVAYTGHNFHQVRRREILRHLGEREKEELPVLAEHRHRVALRPDAEPHLLGRGDRHHLLALPRIGEDFSLRDDEPPPLGRHDEEFSFRVVDEDGDHVLRRVHVDEEPDRLAVPAPAGQLVRLERVEAAPGRGDQHLVGGLRREGEFQRIVALEGEPGNVGIVALQRPDPPLL
jgi:YihY family inner membrane protein